MMFLNEIKQIIPDSKKKKLPFFIGLSLINTFLDFISIALFTPYILLIFDSEKSISFIQNQFSFTITRQLILVSLIVFVVLYILKNIFQSTIIFKKNSFVHSISTEISRDLIKNYFNRTYIENSKQEQSVFLRDFQRIPKKFANTILTSIYQLYSEILIISIFFLISLFINPIITIVSTIFVFFAMYLLLKIKNKKINHLSNTISKSLKDTLSHLLNVSKGFLQIKSSKSEDSFANEFNNANAKHNDFLALLASYKQSNIKFLELFIILGISIIVLYTFQRETPLLNLAILSFFLSATIKLIPSINKISTSIIDIKSNKYTIEILSNYQKLNSHKISEIDFFQSIELKNSSFSYSEKTDLIKNLNTKIITGDFIAITGDSGVGKTTLLRILSGMILPKKGKLIINEEKINDACHLSFLSIVTQQPFIFQGTLLENITMKNNTNVDTSFILSLIEKFELLDWYNSLENELFTELTLDSNTISGGQKQRIVLIRALYQKPRLLLLDEATNQIEEALELKILYYLKSLVKKENLTVIAISHHKNLLQFNNKKIEL